MNDLLEAYKMKIAKNFAEAMFDLHDQMGERIFRENKDINGNKPEPYSTEPISVSKKNYRNVRLGGVKSKTGKTHRFEGGYAQLKSESGRPPIMLFGNLEKSFNNGLREVNDFEYHIVVPKEDMNKIDGHFKTFFKVSKKEETNLINSIVSD